MSNDSSKELYELHADFCKFMGNAKRIEMLFILGEEERCVDDLAHKMDVPIPNVSQHLAIMRDKGIVESRRAGTKVYYRLSNPKTLQACILMREAMIERMEQCVAKVGG
ncbi:MAG: metalloregulator ArsR/SmtB family transcription factor [Eubacteriales bacterium]|nr:metalloregulator ArsR/SmtB family transcription factor [Eubacteriales bacterium]